MRSRFEKHRFENVLLRDLILGGQDGLVNVLGIILGMAIATNSAKLVIIAGLTAMFAESISMAAVAYTSTKAEKEFYQSEGKREKDEIKTIPDMEKKEIREIYYRKGFRRKLLNDIVKKITADKKDWANIMMKEELGLSRKFASPVKSAFVVGISAIIGSLIPLLPFFFLAGKTAMISSLAVSTLALFITGTIEGKLTMCNWFKKGIELAVIGMLAALAGFAIGYLTGNYFS